MEHVHEILTFFLIGWIFWPVIIIETIITWSCFRSAESGTSLFGALMIVLLFCCVTYGTPMLTEWFAQDWLTHILYVAGSYIVIGFFVSGANWMLMLRRYREQIRDYYTEFTVKVNKSASVFEADLGYNNGEKENVRAVAAIDELKPLKGETLKAFNIYVYNEFKALSSGTRQLKRIPDVEFNMGTVRPVVMGDTITQWWAMWPFAIINTIFDPLYIMFTKLTKAFTQFFSKIRDKLAGNVSDII
jgi:hypothetical protein